jgi:hypothetical protein
LSYSDSPGSDGFTSLSSTAATAGLSRLRQQSIPQVIDAPSFGQEQTPEWLEQAQALVGRYAAIAGVVVAVALLIAAAHPTVARARRRQFGRGTNVIARELRTGSSSVQRR